MHHKKNQSRQNKTPLTKLKSITTPTKTCQHTNQTIEPKFRTRQPKLNQTQTSQNKRPNNHQTRSIGTSQAILPSKGQTGAFSPIQRCEHLEHSQSFIKPA
jgi:hypothetical protein